jgi:hypothetical protein
METYARPLQGMSWTNKDEPLVLVQLVRSLQSIYIEFGRLCWVLMYILYFFIRTCELTHKTSNRNGDTCYKQVNGGRIKCVGIPHCQDWVCLSVWVCVCPALRVASSRYDTLPWSRCLYSPPPPLLLMCDVLVSYYSSRKSLWKWNFVLRLVKKEIKT